MLHDTTNDGKLYHFCFQFFFLYEFLLETPGASSGLSRACETNLVLIIRTYTLESTPNKESDERKGFGFVIVRDLVTKIR